MKEAISTETSKEKVYKEDIEPLIQRIALICKQEGIPMFTVVQESPNSYRTTCINRDKSSKINEIYSLNDSWDIDQFLLKLINESKVTGHNSRILRAFGIPFKPS